MEWGNPENLERIPWSKSREPTTNAPHMRHRVGIKQRTQWWETNSLASAPSLLLLSFGNEHIARLDSIASCVINSVHNTWCYLYSTARDLWKLNKYLTKKDFKNYISIRLRYNGPNVLYIIWVLFIFVSNTYCFLTMQLFLTGVWLLFCFVPLQCYSMASLW